MVCVAMICNKNVCVALVMHLTNCFKCHLQSDGISPLVQTSVLGKGVKHRPPPIKMPSGSGSSSSGTPEKVKAQTSGVCKKKIKKNPSIVLSFHPNKYLKTEKNGIHTFCHGVI